MKLLKVFLSFLFAVFFIPTFFINEAAADGTSQFITVVNPVRVSTYMQKAKESLAAQYRVIKENGIPATWLLTYDVLEKEDLLLILKEMDDNQELGIYLEVTPLLAEAANISYHNTGFWHHAESVFLSGYLQDERIKLIDEVFNKFYEVFGYYPKSVGSWWTDSYSLEYMKEKYGITANLGCADQFSTDGYQIWGQYWSTPFYPSKYHSGIPASNLEVKLDLVTIQWAARDPLNGYYSSLYSTQDYLVTKESLDTKYFEKLINLYAEKRGNDFGQITVGLESDLSKEAYTGEYLNQIETVKRLIDTGEFTAVTMSEFSTWYRNNYPDLSPTHFIESDDLLGLPRKVFWYQSPKYRLGLLYDEETKLTKIFDLRSYHSDLVEPNFLSPNREFDLSIYIPSYFDEVNFFEDVWTLSLGELEEVVSEKDEVTINFNQGGKIRLSPEKISIFKDDLVVPSVLGIPSVLKESPLLRITDDGGYEITIKEGWLVGKDGLIIKDLTDEATHHLARKRTTAIVLAVLLIIVTVGFWIRFSKISNGRKLLLLSILIVIPISYSSNWYQKNTTKYYVSQGEIDALFRLSLLPEGKVLVFDKECLGCTWNSSEKPASFANKRNYVRKLGEHPLIYNRSVFTAENQSQAKEEFDKLKVEYIYLSKYEDNIEKIPFSPGDLGIEKIYDNANAEIWKVVR